ncbi:hypothetical protein LBMAG42_26160 [Deltaproteobacteria bacterium]|nr:hypothetical protein LBMAG42_26160 [Deltaproteobacteria bacterium]
MPLALLFVGNSYVFVNELDQTTGALFLDADPTGETLAHREATGGYTLPQHLADADGTNGDTPLRQALVTGTQAWTWTLLQDQSQIPGFPEDQPEVMASLAALPGLDALIEANGGQTMLLMTWGRRDGDSTNPEWYPDYPTMQTKLADGYLRYAAAITTDTRTAWVAPAGYGFRHVWQDAVDAGEDPLDPAARFYRLYIEDGSHPSPLGTYLAACVIYSSISGDVCSGRAAPPSLSAADVVAVQAAADAAVFEESGDIAYPWQGAGEDTGEQPGDTGAKDTADDPEDTGGAGGGASSGGCGCSNTNPGRGWVAAVATLVLLRRRMGRRTAQGAARGPVSSSGAVSGQLGASVASFLGLSTLAACADPAADSGIPNADSAALAADTRSPGHYFPDAAPWTTAVADAPLDPDNDALIAGLASRGWGTGHFQIDFSIEVLEADETTERVALEPTSDFYSPDCDQTPVPLPEGGNVEGEADYACASGGDCHLLVKAEHEARLYEMWRADKRGDTFRGGCLAVWDMDRVYPPEGRGEQCTSADAAGYPIAPLLFTADEVASGTIDHAIRFILPNESIRDGEYYHPATHATNASGGGADALPYGAHLRLKAGFDETRLADPDARVVARALQTYGMFLADGGNIALTAEADARSTHKWADLFEDGSHALWGIEPDDFEVVALQGEAVPLTFECERSGL